MKLTNGTQIKCATSANIPFLFTGPKHGFYTGFEKLQNGLEIYTAALDQITVDADANTITVAGAGRFQDVVNSLYAVGKNIRKFSRASPTCLMSARSLVWTSLT